MRELESHFMGRDGIPYELDYLTFLTHYCYGLEKLAREVLVLIRYMQAPSSSSDDNNRSDVYIFVNGVLDMLTALTRLNEYDTQVKAALEGPQGRSIIMDTSGSSSSSRGLYRYYYSQFLGKWYETSPWASDSAKKISINNTAIAEACRRLSDMVQKFILLCDKVNVYGYDSIKSLLLRGNEDDDDDDDDDNQRMMTTPLEQRQGRPEPDLYLAVRVDRAMRFFKLLTDATDRTYRHVVFISMLPNLTCGPS
jgi:hypothetical protein